MRSNFLTRKFCSRLSVLVLPQHLRIPLALPELGIKYQTVHLIPVPFPSVKSPLPCSSQNEIQTKSTQCFQPRGPWYERGTTSAFARIAVLYFLKLLGLC